MKLVLYPAVDPPRLEKFRAAATNLTVENATDDRSARNAVGDADAFFGKITRAILAAASRLRWVQAPTVSLEHYMFPELVAHPCILTNMRGLYSDIIADQVMGYTICFARNLHHYIRQQQQANWQPIGGESERSNFLEGPARTSAIDRAHQHLCDMTMGVVGLGQIGAEVARRARAFSMRVLAVDPVRTDTPPEVEVLWPLERLDDLLAESDYVVLCAPHTPRSVTMFRREQFRRMRSTAYFINIGRGATVDLSDLAAAIEGGEIAGAALDVFEVEPLPNAHSLWTMPGVIITPHVAGYGRHIAERHLQVVLDNIGRFARGEPLLNVVDKAQWF